MKKGIKGKYWMMAAVVASAAGSMSAQAADWSDNSIGYRYGTKFAEPFNTQDITKNIINFQHASGYKYGTNFLNVDLLMSDSKDSNAQEAYIAYRHTLDLGKISGKDLSFGPARGVGLTLGFDWNTKNDNSYASKKRMWVVGPTLMLDVPGFLNVSVLALFESNQPIGVSSRYSYDTHPMLNLAWGIPLGSTGLVRTLLVLLPLLLGPLGAWRLLRAASPPARTAASVAPSDVKKVVAARSAAAANWTSCDSVMRACVSTVVLK